MQRLRVYIAALLLLGLFSPALAASPPAYTRQDTLDKAKVDRLLYQYAKLAQRQPNDFELRMRTAQLGYYAWRLEEKDNNRRIQVAKLIAKLAREAIALRPDHPGGHLWLGSGLAMVGLPRGILNSLQLVPAGKSAFEKSISLDDQYLEGSAYALMGHAYAVVPGFPLSVGDKEQAMSYLAKARKISPNSTLVPLFIADLLWTLGRDDEALKTLEEIPSKKPQTELEYFLFETNKRKAAELEKLIESGASRDPLFDVLSDIEPGLVD